MTSSMMRQHWEDSELLGLVRSAATTKAFHKVQPRARAHVLLSNRSAF